NIIGEMVEATEFPQLAQKYYVMGVPKTVINEGAVQFEGAYPEDQFIEKVMEAYEKA
ncbi:MAG: thioredoxin family protein, partial [Candidatus Heimdallarchaeota archaeon]|nr:thioredoxin family protein [Candidatus Heimdallarchaeota archaeon]MCK4878828.1 thioredoxin family protein [Candidatus Heimdallarchaeota archaeon]